MSAESLSSVPQDEVPHSMPAPAPTIGQTLRSAREASGMSAADAAKALKLSTYQIEALEADSWSVLPCTTIVRGFVRNYARLLKLDADHLLGHLQSTQSERPLEMPMGTRVSMPLEGRVRKKDKATVFAGLSVLAVALVMFFFVPQNFWQDTLAGLKTATQSAGASTEGGAAKLPLAQEQVAPLSADKSPAVAIAAPNVTVLSDAPQAPAARPEQAPVVPPANAVDTAVADKDVPPPAQLVSGTIGGANSGGAGSSAGSSTGSSAGDTLKFSFAQPSWVEVRDKNGDIIFSQLSPAGSQKEIAGKPPYALVVGNASHVALSFRGKLVDLSQRSKDDVARLTVK